MAVQVVTGDGIFARMVIRLLEGAGIAAVHSTRKSGSFERAVVDLDFADSPRLGEHCVTVSKSPNVGADLTRPFLTDALILLAASRFGEPAVLSALPPPDLAEPAQSDSVPPSSPPELTPNGVLLDGRTVFLSPKERALLDLLLARRGQVVDRAEITQTLFPDAPGNNPEVYISYLRAKLDYTVGRRIIRTVRGKGYTID